MIVLFSFCAGIKAQDFLSPSFTFSHSKTSYITMKNGKEMKGHIKGLKRKKGLIKLVKFEDGEGNKIQLKPEQIKFMYLYPDLSDRINKAKKALTDTKKWNDEKMDQDLLNQQYVYFETTKVKVKKKKEMTLLMQLLNPSFSKKVKVYHDPFAKETASLGVAGIKVVGGIAKSYYIKTTGRVAFKVQKKRYKKEFKPMWRKCEAMIKKYTTIKWEDLAKHITEFTDCTE